MTELKPCPFCGWIASEDIDMNKGMIYISCGKCRARTIGSSLSDKNFEINLKSILDAYEREARKWNRRDEQ